MTMLKSNVWVACCLGVLGCAAQVDTADEGQVAVSEQAIMGGVDYVSCTPRERGMLRSAAIMGRIYAKSAAYGQCIDKVMRTGDTFFGPYQPQPGDRAASSTSGHVSNVLAASRTAYPAEVTCEELETLAGWAAYQGWMHTHSDWMKIDEGSLAD